MLTKDGWEIASESVDGTGEEKEDLAAAEQLRRIVRRITLDEFRWQDAHYDADSQRGRELLFLYANNEWVRATAEIVDITRSDAVDTSIKIDIDLDQITHEAFRKRTGRFWLPVIVLPPPQPSEEAQNSPGRPRLDPDPFATVTDAAGDLLAMLPSVDVRHQISAALAEIIINVGVARWSGPGQQRPPATRDERLLLSAAIYGFLRREPGAVAVHEQQEGAGSLNGEQRDAAGPAAADGREDSRRKSRMTEAKAQLLHLLDFYIELLRERSSIAEGRHAADGDAGHAADGEGGHAADGTAATESSSAHLPDFVPEVHIFSSELASRGVKVLRAFTESVVLVIPIERESSPTTVTVRVPTREMKRSATKKWRNLWTWILPTIGLLQIDVLLPSASADRLVQINLPDGVSFRGHSASAATHEGYPRMVIEVERPQPLRDLDSVMTGVISRATTLPPALQHCLADLALTKTEAAHETLRQYWITPEYDPEGPSAKAEADARAELRTLRTELMATLRDHSSQISPDDLAKPWRKFRDLSQQLFRRASADSPTPRTVIARANMIEETYHRASSRDAKVYVGVTAAAEYRSPAVVSGVMSILLMALVLILRLTYRATPSPEVLAIVLTLFSAIQAARIETSDRSTLRGLLSAVGNRLIVASILPPVILAVALGFSSKPIWTLCWAGVLILFEGAMIWALQRVQWTGKWSFDHAQHWELTTEPPDYRHSLALQSEWWCSSTADALMIGRKAYAYIVPQNEAQSTETLKELLKDPHQGKPTPNLLALLRSGTVGQALTFMVFREEPAGKWAHTPAYEVDIRPDRLVPLQSFVNTVEVFVAFSREELLTVADHPIANILKAARGLTVLEVQLPVPAPYASYTDRRWARVRLALRSEVDIKRLTKFLYRIYEASEGDQIKGDQIIGVQTVPGGPWIIGETKPGAAAETPILASDMDVVTAVPDMSGGDDLTWRVMAICADARTGIENDILQGLACVRKGLKVAGLTYALMYGTAVMFLLGYDPEGETARKADLQKQLAAIPGLEKVTVAVDQWRSQSELGRAENHPLLQAHFREQDRAGALVDVLDALGHVFQYDMQPTFGRGEWKVWHAQMQVTSGRTAHTRLTIRLNTAARRAAQITFNEIEYKITEAARKAAAARAAAHSADRGWDPPEDPVISISLITAPGHELGTPEQG